MPLEIADLADHPHLVPQLAAWFFAQWGHLRPNNSLAATEARVRGYLNRDTLPLTLVALRDGRCVGTASLRLDDMATRPELAPWLSSVYVPAAERRQGIAAALVRAAEARAAALGVARLHLYTPDQERLYARLGWEAVERTEYRGESVVLMRKELAPAAPGAPARG